MKHFTICALFSTCLLSFMFLFQIGENPANQQIPNMSLSYEQDDWGLDGYWVDLPENNNIYQVSYHVNSWNDDKSNVQSKKEWLMSVTDVSNKTAEKIVVTANKYEHGDLLLAMMTVESDARPNLKYANNYGLCQVSTVHFAKEEQDRVNKMGFSAIRDCGVYTVNDLYDINKNICSANAIFSRILKESNNNYRLALKRYNANPRLKEQYSRKVMNRYFDLREASSI